MVRGARKVRTSGGRRKKIGANEGKEISENVWWEVRGEEIDENDLENEGKEIGGNEEKEIGDNE